MLAVLTDALDCLSGRAIDARGRARQQEAHRAAEWVALDSDMFLVSFNSVCETLGIDPDALREALKSWCGAERRLTARLNFVPRRTKVRAHRAFARRRVGKGQNRSHPTRGREPSAQAVGRRPLARQADAAGHAAKKIVRPECRRELVRAPGVDVLSERAPRMCGVAIFNRSSHRYRANRNDQAMLRGRIRGLAAARVRYGYSASRSCSDVKVGRSITSACTGCIARRAQHAA